MIKSKILYLVSCVVFSLGASYFIRSGLGTDPLDVFCLGVQNTAGLKIGTTQCAFALACLALWSSLNSWKMPPWSTFLTFFLCGYMIDFLRWNIPTFNNAYFNMVFGSILCLQGSAGIIASGFGIRAMDLVSLSLEDKLNIPFWISKASFETALLASGHILGGPVGIGTVVFLVVVGYLIQPCVILNERVLTKFGLYVKMKV